MQPNTNLEYEVDIILPEQVLNLGIISSYCFDNSDALWITSSKGISRYDGNDLLTYSINEKKGYLETGGPQQAIGYVIINKDSLWLENDITHDVFLIDLPSKKIIKKIKAETNYKRNILFKNYDNSVYKLYITHDERMYIQNASGSDSNSYYLQNADDFYSAVIHNSKLWISFEDSLVQYNLKGKRVRSLPPLFQLFSSDCSYGLHSLYAWSKNIYLWNEHLQKFDSLRLMNSLKIGNPHTYKMNDKYWISNLLNLKLWNPQTNIYQDYTQRIRELTAKRNPTTLNSELKYRPLYHKNNIWFFTKNSIYKFSPSPLPPKDLKVTVNGKHFNKSFREITADDKGTIYALYYSNILFKPSDSKNFKPLPQTRNILADNAAYAMSSWKNKLIWNNKVINLNNKHSHNICEPIFQKHIAHYLEKDTLWLADWWEIKFYKYNLWNDSLEVLNKFGEDRDMAVSDMKLDKESHLFWLATSTGIYLINRSGQVKKHYTKQELQLEDANIYNILIDKNNVWFGCSIGLGKINKKSAHIEYYKKDFINEIGNTTHRVVYDILPDDDNLLYLGTSRGILSFNKKDFSMKTLIPEHQLFNVEFNRNSAYRDDEGKYYFGSIEGLYQFEQKDLLFENTLDLNNITLTLVNINSLKKGRSRKLDYELQSLNKLELESTDANLTLVYSSPHAEKKVLYKYKIAGLKNEWSQYSNTGIIELTTFPPGTYDLEIRAYLQAESDSYKSYKLTIVKPKLWFQRAWVQIMIFLLFGSAITLFLRYRHKLKMDNQKRLELLRVNISSDLHDDVGTILSGIAASSELLHYKNKIDTDESNKLKELSEMSRRAMDGMRDVVWAIDSRKDKYEDLIARMRNFAEQTLSTKNIAHNFRIENIEGESFLDPVTRQNYYLIFKEAITNIIKHSDATKVDISFIKKGASYILSIHDNGNKTSSLPISGLGLSNMKMRAEKINAQLQINANNGFCIKLTK